jgi:hypothetical protein
MNGLILGKMLAEEAATAPADTVVKKDRRVTFFDFIFFLFKLVFSRCSINLLLLKKSVLSSIQHRVGDIIHIIF